MVGDEGLQVGRVADETVQDGRVGPRTVEPLALELDDVGGIDCGDRIRGVVLVDQS